MNYKKRISAILLASALSVGLLAGCGGNSDSGSASGDSVEITNVSYDPTRELYQQLNSIGSKRRVRALTLFSRTAAPANRRWRLPTVWKPMSSRWHWKEMWTR